MPHPPDEYFYGQITKHKEDISLLQAEVQSLHKRLDANAEHLVRQGEELVDQDAKIEQLKQRLVSCLETLVTPRRSWWSRILGNG